MTVVVVTVNRCADLGRRGCRLGDNLGRRGCRLGDNLGRRGCRLGGDVGHKGRYWMTSGWCCNGEHTRLR